MNQYLPPSAIRLLTTLVGLCALLAASGCGDSYYTTSTTNYYAADAGPSAETTRSLTYTVEARVPSPDYSLDFSGYDISSDIDDVVHSVTGSIAITSGGNLGEWYVVDTNQDLGSAFADIDAAYAAGQAVALDATIADVMLVGATLPTHRNLIILHDENAVKSYQVFWIRFNAPL